MDEESEYSVTSEYTKLIGSPYYLVEPDSGSGEFFIGEEYASTSNNVGCVLLGDKPLVLGKDILEVVVSENEDPIVLTKIRDDEHPGKFINAIRDYSHFWGYDYVADNHLHINRSWKNQIKSIIVTPRLFIPAYETGVDLRQSFSESLGIDPRFLR